MLGLRQRRRVAWIAVFAILLNALAPAMSHALAARFGGAWLEVCTADGLKRAAIRHESQRPDLPPGASIGLADHCPYCAPHGASVAHVPPAGPLVAVQAGPARIAVVLPDGAPQRVVVTSGDARAPPAIS